MEWLPARLDPAVALAPPPTGEAGRGSGSAPATSPLQHAKPHLASELYAPQCVTRSSLHSTKARVRVFTLSIRLAIAQALEHVEQQRQHLLLGSTSASHPRLAPSHHRRTDAPTSPKRPSVADDNVLLCGCGEELRPPDRQLHLTSECPLREVQCPRPGCGAVFPANRRADHERVECVPARRARKLFQAKEDGDTLVQCERCLDKRVPVRKRDLGRHQRFQCVQRLVCCQFAEWGCTDEFPHAERATHEATVCVVATRRQQLAAHVNAETTCDWCQQVVKKRQLLDHQEDECLERERPCPNAASGCTEWMPVGKASDHVRDRCCVTLERDTLAAKARAKNARVECTECGETLAVRQLSRHWRDECVSRIVGCKNAAHGCKARLRWRDRHLHEDVRSLARDRSVLEFETGGAAYVTLSTTTLATTASDSEGSDLAPPWTAEYYVRLLDAETEVLDLLRTSLRHLETQVVSAREHERWRDKAAACKQQLKQLKQRSKHTTTKTEPSSSRQQTTTHSAVELAAAATSLADAFAEAEEGLAATQKAAALAKGWIQVLLTEAVRIVSEQQLSDDAASDLQAAIAAQSALVLLERPQLAELLSDADRSRLGDLTGWAASVVSSQHGDPGERQQKLAEQKKLLAKRAEWTALLAGLRTGVDAAVSSAETERLRRRYERELGKVDARLAVVTGHTPTELLERRGRHVLASSARNALALVSGPHGHVSFFQGTREVPLNCALLRGRWHHVALSVSPQELRVYLDSDLRSVKRGVFELPLRFIGATDGVSSFQGLLQEVRYWRECRSPTQLRRFAHTVLPLASCAQKLVGYWPLEEGMGTLLDDLALHLPRSPAFHTRWRFYDSAAARRRLGTPPTPSLRERASCAVTQTLKLLAQRARDRESEFVSCRQGCGESVLLRQLEHHQRLECRHRLVVCPEPGCAQLVRFTDAATHANERCERRIRREELVQRHRERAALESCGLGCGLTFQHGFAEHHYRTECKKRLVACPRHDCGERIVAETLAAHLKSECKSAELARERQLVTNSRVRLMEKEQQLQLQHSRQDSKE